MEAYFEIIRPSTSIIAGLGAVIGALVSGLPLSLAFFYVFLAVFYITAGGLVINDYYDFKIDKVNAPHRPIPSGRISRKNALRYSIALFLAGLFFSALLNVYCFLLALINTILQFVYSKHLKKTFLMGNTLVSWFAASTFIFGSLLTFDFKITWVIALLSFLANMGREIFKAIEDIKGDKKMKLDTLPIAVGIDSAKQIAQGFIASAVLLSPLPYLSGFLKVGYLKMVYLGDFLFLYSLSQTPTKTKGTTKLAMYIVILALLLSA
jgi:geranylgeranylglycerol-phosphate geranylgeranyltransferase